MKVRCSYCKTEFEMEPETRGECPACHRVALLRQATKPITRRVDREKSGRRLPPMASVFFSGLGPVRRVVFGIGVVVSLVGLLSLGPRAVVSDPTMPPGKTQRARALRELNVLNIALSRFTHDCGHAPSTEEGWNALVNNPGYFDWNGPYVVPGVKPDPWHHWYVYRNISSNEWNLFSMGLDGIEGTADDLRAEASE